MGFVRSVRSFGVLCSLMVLLSLMSGCGEPEPRFVEQSPASAATTPAATALTDQPSASPTQSASAGPQEEAAVEMPAYPEAARGRGRAAAVAFVQHYFSVVDYATNTGDVGPLHRLNSPRCDGCRSGEALLTDVYDAGGHYERIVQEVRDRRVDPFEGPTGREWLLAIDVSNNRHALVRKNGSRRVYTAQTVPIEVMLENTGPAESPWRVTDLRSAS